MYYMFKDTPAGPLLLIGDGQTLGGIYWKVYKRVPVIGRDWIANASVFDEVSQQIDEYFAGTRQTFDVASQVTGTDFQKSVWKELDGIPYGGHTTYQAIAAAIGKPKAVRAVGTAVGSNPLSIIVPCHRVLASTGKLGGYAGGLDSKKVLLQREKIPFVD